MLWYIYWSPQLSLLSLPVCMWPGALGPLQEYRMVQEEEHHQSLLSRNQALLLAR